MSFDSISIDLTEIQICTLFSFIDSFIFDFVKHQVYYVHTYELLSMPSAYSKTDSHVFSFVFPGQQHKKRINNSTVARRIIIIYFGARMCMCVCAVRHCANAAAIVYDA